MGGDLGRELRAPGLLPLHPARGDPRAGWPPNGPENRGSPLWWRSYRGGKLEQREEERPWFTLLSIPTVDRLQRPRFPGALASPAPLAFVGPTHPHLSFFFCFAIRRCRFARPRFHSSPYSHLTSRTLRARFAYSLLGPHAGLHSSESQARAKVRQSHSEQCGEAGPVGGASSSRGRSCGVTGGSITRRETHSV